MANAEMVRPFVEKTIAEVLGLESVKKDDDGDVPVVHGSSVTFVRVFDGPVGPVVRFFSPILNGVQKTPALLERLNDLNMQTVYVQFFWVNQQVMCALDLDAADLQKEEIGQALVAVEWHADTWDDELQKDFGGKTMISAEDAAKPDSPSPSGPAGYL